MAKLLNGRVVSAGNDKTITVSVSTRKVHPVYKKRYNVTRKYAAHDEKNQAKLDDLVTIEETRPISKSKRFALKEITGTAAIKHEEAAPEPKAAEEDTK